MKLSVVVPVYNSGEYLKECLDSIASQTFSEFEVICVDDKSTDCKTIQILRDFGRQDHRFRVVWKEKNEGAAAARNTGLYLAKGDYIFFLDSDDLFMPNYFSAMLQTMESEPGIDVVCTSFGAFQDDNRKKDKIVPISFKKMNDESFNLEEISGKYFERSSYNILFLNVWTKLFKKEFILNKKVEFQSLHCCNDVFFTIATLSLAKKIKICDTQSPYIWHREKTNAQISASRNPWDLWNSVSYCLIHKDLRKSRNEIWKLWAENSIGEIQICNDTNFKKEYYFFFSNLISNGNKYNIPQAILDNPLYRAIARYPYEYSWIFDPEGRYYRELLASDFKIDSTQIVVWGNGVRSQAIQHYLKDHSVNNVIIVDQKNENIGSLTKWNYIIDFTDKVKSSCHILASNHEIYCKLKLYYPFVIDMEAFCP